MSVSKMIMGQAANRYVDPVYVENLFSTHLYTGNGGSTATINNGIDLTGKGGLVWIKARNAAENHVLFDTDRGVTKYLSSNLTNAEATSTGTLTNFYNNGFKVDGGGTVGSSTDPYASWTFRKQAKFFDIVTWTGTGSAMTIDHNLGQVPGMIIVKSTSATYDWAVWHREYTGTTDYIKLNTIAAKTDSAGVFGNGSTYLTPTSTQFFVGGNNQVSGEVGGGYVAYLFAHNDGDGGFGVTNDQDIIKCGSYTGNGSSTGPVVDLGFEPQFIFSKRSDSTSQWNIVDNMRGLVTGGSDVRLYPNLTNADDPFDFIEVTPTGFKLASSGTAYNASGGTYIYMAIRRGDMAVPTDATKVFAIGTYGANRNSSTTDTYFAGFPVDMALKRVPVTSTASSYLTTRMLGTTDLSTNSTDAERTGETDETWDSNTHWNKAAGTSTTSYSWMWKRAPSYFDVVAYTGDGGAGTLQNHNLGVVPEMIWIKRRDSTGNWGAYHKALPSLNKHLYLDLNGSYSTGYGTHIAPTATQFCVGGYAVMGGTNNTNASGGKFIAYLFATVPNVSFVGSFVGDGNNGRVIDCGFSGGARFILIKGATNTENWYIFDTVRGIVAGNDARLQLDNTSAEFSNVDLVDPSNSGFIVNSGNEVNASGVTYIFYAIA